MAASQSTWIIVDHKMLIIFGINYHVKKLLLTSRCIILFIIILQFITSTFQVGSAGTTVRRVELLPLQFDR